MSFKTAAATLRPGDILRTTTAAGCRIAGTTRRANGEILIRFAEPWRIPLALSAADLVTVDRVRVGRR